MLHGIVRNIWYGLDLSRLSGIKIYPRLPGKLFWYLRLFFVLKLYIYFLLSWRETYFLSIWMYFGIMTGTPIFNWHFAEHIVSSFRICLKTRLSYCVLCSSNTCTVSYLINHAQPIQFDDAWLFLFDNYVILSCVILFGRYCLVASCHSY